MADLVSVYDSASAQYQRAFSVFLQHTNEKHVIKNYLQTLVQQHAPHHHFLDAGAGTGVLTQWVSQYFSQTSAIEPNTFLTTELKQRCPHAKLYPTPIMQTTLDPTPGPADFILCSHVLYYIPRNQWADHLNQLSHWLAPAGQLVVILQSAQSHATQVQNLAHDYTPDLVEFARQWQPSKHGLEKKLDQAQAWIDLPDLNSAKVVAEFMLNLQPMTQPPAWSVVEEFLHTHTKGDIGYQLSVHQDFLVCTNRD